MRITAEQDTARATSPLIEIQTAYAVRGIKQRRDPKYALAAEGALFEYAYARPASAPSFAAPPNRTPRSALPEAGMFV